AMSRQSFWSSSITRTSCGEESGMEGMATVAKDDRSAADRHHFYTSLTKITAMPHHGFTVRCSIMISAPAFFCHLRSDPELNHTTSEPMKLTLHCSLLGA